LISASFQENDSIERPVPPPEGTESMFLKYKIKNKITLCLSTHYDLITKLT
jgi:hypothetical protein